MFLLRFAAQGVTYFAIALSFFLTAGPYRMFRLPSASSIALNPLDMVMTGVSPSFLVVVVVATAKHNIVVV
jgi:hypothetical protein